jgi:formylmethanofuran dehydrogenase subunit E
MTRRVANTVFIEAESDRRCELCGEIEETRPYGPNGERVCFACGMKDEESAKRKFSELMDGKIQ